MIISIKFVNIEKTSWHSLNLQTLLNLQTSLKLQTYCVNSKFINLLCFHNFWKKQLSRAYAIYWGLINPQTILIIKNINCKLTLSCLTIKNPVVAENSVDTAVLKLTVNSSKYSIDHSTKRSWVLNEVTGLTVIPCHTGLPKLYGQFLNWPLQMFCNFL